MCYNLISGYPLKIDERMFVPMAEKAAAKAKTTAKKAETAAKTAKPAAKKAEKADPVIKTILQYDGKEIDVTTVAADALKKYKSVHKRKVVKEFVVYVKPEENAAYFTVNGEGDENDKVPL